MKLRAPMLVVALLAACAVALISVELGSGALGFGEANLANPCTAKPQLHEGRFFGSVDAAVQRFALSGLDGAACSLHTTREELVLSFSPSLATHKVRWEKATIRKALRGGLTKAAHDTAGNGLLGDALAFVFREAIADPIAFFLGEFAT